MKLCLLCHRRIRPTHTLCVLHFKEYRTSMHEPWFKALLEEQRIQDSIDKIERDTLPQDNTRSSYTVTPIHTIGKQGSGRSTDWRIVDRILRLYDDSQAMVQQHKRTKPLSLRALEKAIDGVVDHCTIRKILQTYR